MSRVSRGIVAVGVLAALALGLTPAAADDPLDHLSICSPNRDFTADEINNPYSPFLPGQVASFSGEDDEGPLGLRITVLDATRTLYRGKQRVVTRVVEEVEWLDDGAIAGVLEDGEELIEVSLNYFAQVLDGPRPGTVCYFGEDVKIYEEGRFRGDREGSWRADAKGNAPGIFMPGSPLTPQMNWSTEAAPGVAEDTARVVGFEDNKKVGEDTFDDVMEVEDCNPLEPAPNCGTKYYAPGVGLIIDGPVELTEFEIG